MGLIKDVYSPEFYNEFSEIATGIIPEFNKKQFLKIVLPDNFTQMEWKERLKKTTKALHEVMPSPFTDAVNCIKQMIVKIRKDKIAVNNFAFLFLPDYVETYGIDDPETSAEALEFITTFISCEYAVRPFIDRYENIILDKMLVWSKSENEHVRRLSSEGCRPRLPWAMALPKLKKDPAPIFPILENLKNDPSEYVRRSVANNLNDIGKDHPDLLLEVAEKWKGLSKYTDAIIKHACRNLLKQGHPVIMKYYGLDGTNAEITNFGLAEKAVAIGSYLPFSFVVTNKLNAPQYIRLEYAIYYKRSNGSHSKKVFKISEKSYAANEKLNIKRSQSFKLITTRKFYPGIHRLTIIANGIEREEIEFNLVENDAQI